MLANEWIDRVKQHLGLESDYQVSKKLEVTRQYISQLRSGKYRSLSTKTAIRVAHVLEIDPMIVIEDQLEQREQQTGAITARALIAVGTIAISLIMVFAAFRDIACQYILCKIRNRPTKPLPTPKRAPRHAFALASA
jgi:plasmid maintenance system antidote protein VapI